MRWRYDAVVLGIIVVQKFLVKRCNAVHLITKEVIIVLCGNIVDVINA